MARGKRRGRLDWDLSPNSADAADDGLLAEFSQLWAEADEVWEQRENAPGFHSYVSADYPAVYKSLELLRGRVHTFLEWGSGLGVVTIMASRMGFDAYGIEVELTLVELAERLSRSYRSNAKFAHGSFVPDGFDWDPAVGDEIEGTTIDVQSAYDGLDMRLSDFDLVYAYPWPNEHELYHHIMREFGSDNAMFLSYDAREGIQYHRFPAV